jgi:GTP pyrophosphokinase
MKSKEEVLAFATKAHEGQRRKDGKDYITHPIAVAEIALDLLDKNWFEGLERFLSKEESELVVYHVAILHDVIEDTYISYVDLFNEFGFYVADRVNSLSRHDDETYYEFIMNIKESNDIFLLIAKLADLTHNISDLSGGSLKDKYLLAKHIIEEEINSMLDYMRFPHID